MRRHPARSPRSLGFSICGLCPGVTDWPRACIDGPAAIIVAAGRTSPKARRSLATREGSHRDQAEDVTNPDNVGERGSRFLKGLANVPQALLRLLDDLIRDCHGSVLEASRRGLSVPSDIAIGGFGDSDLAAAPARCCLPA